MIKGTLDYINGRVIEHKIKQSNFKFSSESRLMPMFLRTKVGGAEIMIHFLYPNSVFPEEEYVMQYFPVTLELVLFIDFTNDILSYYKEFCLDDETGNFVANFADAHHVQHLDVLRYLTSYTPTVSFRFLTLQYPRSLTINCRSQSRLMNSFGIVHCCSL